MSVGVTRGLQNSIYITRQEGSNIVPVDPTTTVARDGNVLRFPSLSSPFVVGNFLLGIRQGNQRGYKDFVLDFDAVERAFPNVCAPVAGIIEYYRSQLDYSFEFKNVPDFLQRTHTLAPLVVTVDSSRHGSLLNTVWKFASAGEIQTLAVDFLDEVSRAAVCEEGVIQGLEWCVNEIMDNVLQHANTTHGYVMGQIHPSSQHIALCVYDYGQGIFNSLRSSQHAPENEVDAITLAVKEGVTRDKVVGQGNGMWGLCNIVRANSGILNITSGSGFLGMHGDDTNTSQSVPFLSRDHNCTTVDFQIDFDKVISIPEALGGYEPTNLRVENLEDTQNNVVYRLADKSSGTGTRQSGEAIRNEVINITKQTDSVVLLDFNGVSVVSSSFADEFIGKLAVEFGFIGFTQRFRLVGMNATIQAITNRSVSQRLGTGNGG